MTAKLPIFASYHFDFGKNLKNHLSKRSFQWNLVHNRIWIHLHFWNKISPEVFIPVGFYWQKSVSMRVKITNNTGQKFSRDTWNSQALWSCTHFQVEQLEQMIDDVTLPIDMSLVFLKLICNQVFHLLSWWLLLFQPFWYQIRQMGLCRQHSPSQGTSSQGILNFVLVLGWLLCCFCQ